VQRNIEFLEQLLKTKKNSIEIMLGIKIGNKRIITRRTLDEYYCECDSLTKTIIIKISKNMEVKEFELPLEFIIEGNINFDDDVIFSLEYISESKDIHMVIVMHLM